MCTLRCPQTANFIFPSVSPSECNVCNPGRCWTLGGWRLRARASSLFWKFRCICNVLLCSRVCRLNVCYLLAKSKCLKLRVRVEILRNSASVPNAFIFKSLLHVHCKFNTVNVFRFISMPMAAFDWTSSKKIIIINPSMLTLLSFSCSSCQMTWT